MTDSERDPREVLEERVANGIRWLTEHDPVGAFHFWFKAGLLPSSPMPRQTEEVIEQWKAYYSARVKWEQLFKRLERLERERGTATPA